MWKPRFPQSEKPLGEAIAEQIEAAILSGELRPGERMPTHRGLARQLGVGIGTVTRAYNLARSQGLLSGEVGRGTYVLGSAPTSRQVLTEEARLFLLSGREFGEALRAALDSLARRPRFSEALMTPEPQGALRVREAAAKWIEWCGLPSDPDRILPLAGTRATVAVILDTLLCPGEVVLTEELGWAGTLVPRLRERLVPVAIDGEGIIPEALDEACRTHRAKVLLCNPTLHIPTSALMSNARRRAVAKICAQHGLWIIEDDPGIPIVRNEVVPLSLYLPERSIYLADPSPLLHPGVRGCYVQAPPEILREINETMLATFGRSHHLEHEVMRLWFENGTAERLIGLRLADYRGRQQVARELLDGCDYQTHPSDSEIWIRLPDDPDEQNFVEEMRSHGATLEPGAEYEIRSGAGHRGVCFHLGWSPIEKMPAHLRHAASLLKGSS